MDNNKLIENRYILPSDPNYQKRQALIKQRLNDMLTKARKEDIVYVIGHKHPDADSVFSSYVLVNVLTSLGIKCNYAIMDKDYEVLESEQKLVHDFIEYEPVVVDTNHKFILVDHNNLEGLSKENIIGCIDHHIITGEVDDLIEIEYTSTGLLIYDLFKELHQFSDKDKTLIGLTVLTDSDYLCSTRFTELDKKIYEGLNIDLDVSSLQKEYFQITNFDGVIDDIVRCNYKEYNYQGELIRRTMIYSYDREYDMYYDKYVEYANSHNMLLIWANYESKKTYIVYNGEETVLDYILTSTNLVLKKLFDKQKVV